MVVPRVGRRIPWARRRRSGCRTRGPNRPCRVDDAVALRRMPSGPPLPEHPELRSIAEAFETAKISGEILDANWCVVFISSEEARIVGVEPSEVGRFYGKGLPRRQLEDAEYWATTDDSSREWWKLNVPIMRNHLEPGGDALDSVFGHSALFLVEQLGSSESEAGSAAVRAARAIRDGAALLGPDDVDVRINVGIHWGATLMIGQVATSGRLEVTALGDEMNEAARIESAATGGVAFASKLLLERLEPSDAADLSLDPDALSYITVAELDGSSEKAVRDAGSISVTRV
jgi:class 3 adenylate cyclase